MEGTVITGTSSNYDANFLKVGPVPRYYFRTSTPKLKPLVGISADYVHAAYSFSISDEKFEIKQGYLAGGAFLGVQYFVQEKVYVGGVLRVDYYFVTVVKDELSGFDLVGSGTTDTFKEMTTDGWIPVYVFFILGCQL